jgi:FtsH-binding integral membrane protein
MTIFWFLVSLVILALGIIVCIRADKLSVVYAMVVSATAGICLTDAIRDAQRNDWPDFLFWAIWGLICVTTVARWLQFNAWRFVDQITR